jgi:transcription initiation factor TFIIB
MTSSSSSRPILCSICKSNEHIITDPESGEIICGNCAIVISDRIEDNIHQENRGFTSEEIGRRARTGSPTSLARHDKGLYTIIGRANRDASGQLLDATSLSTIERLRLWDSRIQLHNPNYRSLKQGLYELDAVKDKLGLSNAVVEKAAYIFRKAQEKKLVAGRTISGIMAAAVYAACREMDSTRTIKDVSAASNVRRKDIARNYRLLVNELDVKIPVVDPIKCVAKVANTAQISEKTKRQAMTIMEEIIQKEIPAGKNPMGLAAVSLYIACRMTGEYISQGDISKVAGVTEVTLRNRFKDLKDKLELCFV